MNIRYTFFALLLIIPFLASSQSEIVFEINHQLNEASFELDMEGTNNLDNKIKFTRIEYYISGVSVTHDGGQVTEMEDLYILVNGADKLSVPMGIYDIDDVESLNFHIGVDAAVNHEDPSLWPSTHPLAPKNPSMHWGWAGGYRFIAIEGFSGASFGEKFELHGLDDVNYFQVSLKPDITQVGGVKTLTVNANYDKIIEDIDVSKGLISHGGLVAAKQGLENFRDYVFTSSNSTSSVSDLKVEAKFNVFPNPTTSSTIYISNIDLNQTSTFQLLDPMGRIISSQVAQDEVVQFEVTNKGLYFIKQVFENNTFAIQKTLVQ